MRRASFIVVMCDKVDMKHCPFYTFLRHDSRNKGMKHSWKIIPSFLGIEPGPPG